MITVIQACKEKDLRYQKDIDGLKSVIEVLTPEGDCPSRLRNLAANQARGDILLFLDDDSSISQMTIDLYAKLFSDPNVQIAGGPAEIRGNGHFKLVLSSFFAMGRSSARYIAFGVKRRSCERELILCNLAVRKECFVTLGGFDECLYPWEENDFLIKAHKNAVQMIYDPQLHTERGMTTSLYRYLKKIVSYGESRGKEGGINRLEYFAALMFAPAFLIIYNNYILILFAFYLLCLFIEGLYLRHSIISCTKKVFYTFLTHVFYSLGLWKGLGKRLFLFKRFSHLLNSRN